MSPRARRAVGLFYADMKPYPETYLTASTAPAATTDSLGRHIRWQILLALVGLVILGVLLGFSTYTVETVTIPDHGGVYREGVAGPPQYLNPLLCQASATDEDLCALLYRGLTKIDKQGRVVPDLAQAWTVENGLVYTFRLRDDQFWHDGEPITADDVLFTTGLLQDPDLVALPDLASLWRTVTVEKLDDYSVRFSLREPFTPFMDYTSIGLLPEHIWAGTPANVLASSPLTEMPIGSGPMRVADIKSDHIALEPNPFTGTRPPYLSGLQLKYYPDHPSLFAAFDAGEIDGISQILPTELPVAAARDDLQLFSSVESSYVNIIFNLRNPDVPFLQDPNVRKALYYGLNREALIDDVINGQGIVAHSLLLPENWAYNPNVTKYDYNPDLARQMLDEAGWVDSDGDGIRDKDGQPMQFLLHANDESVQSALITRIAEDWQALGVNVVATPVPFATLVGDLLTPRRFEAALIGWELTGDPDPYPLWHSTQIEGGGQNYSGWDNAEADTLLEQGRAIVDLEERRGLYAEFQRIFTDELPALLLYYPVYTYGVSDRVHNVQVGSLNHASERFETFPDWYIVTRRVPVNQAPPGPPVEPQEAGPQE